MLVAATAKGICRLTFDEDERALRRRFPNATILPADDGDGVAGRRRADGDRNADGDARPAARRRAAPPSRKRCGRSCARSRSGETRSYADIAAAVGQPRRGARGRHGQRLEPGRGAGAVPPGDPQRRHASAAMPAGSTASASCSRRSKPDPSGSSGSKRPAQSFSKYLRAACHFALASVRFLAFTWTNTALTASCHLPRCGL